MKIATVIVTYNAESFIEKCIRSLEQVDVDSSIIVIDNGSSDRTTQIIKDNFSQVQLIESEVNLGFGKANNLGINLALSQQADFVFLLNQDAWLEKDAFSQLLTVAEVHPEYGILSPLHLKYDGSDWHKGFRRYIEMFAPSLLVEIETAPAGVYEVDFVPAALWLLSSSALKTAGGFDPIYFMYGEDNDLAARIRAAGFKVGVAPAAKGYHMEKNFSDRGVPVRRLVSKYFSSYIAILKYSHHNIVWRYFSILKSAVRDAFKKLIQDKQKEAKAIFFAIFKILKIIPDIEASRKEIQDEGAFLN
ncbi:glycosyltransferase family 2 protein [Leptolyngbya ohadii]|uniref:glycosyltransferase family 2 protein n=1 Tax=Leptolyngbya ohadii TaxID=1962290 RepID=UPI000B59BC4D|nr:glycosyltransferase family 2 protein [Leptolyngbya ohadii]